MGILRFALAGWVLLAHSGERFLGIRFVAPETAVTVFFVISGFYMALVLKTRYRGNLRAFYFNRFLRLFPSYWLVLAGFLGAALVYRLATGHERYFWVGWDPPSGRLTIWLLSVLANIGIVGSDVFAWFRDGRYFGYLAIPPVWSVAVEIGFYALAPLLIRLPLIWQIATFAGASLLPDRMVPGRRYLFMPAALPYFIAGLWSYRMYEQWIRHRAGTPLSKWVGMLSITGLIAGIALQPPALVNSAWLFPALVAAAIPFTFATLRTSRVDLWIAQWSYPMYLAHWLPLVLFACLSPRIPLQSKSYFVLLATMAIAAVVLFFDRLVQQRFKRHV